MSNGAAFFLILLLAAGLIAGPALLFKQLLETHDLALPSICLTNPFAQKTQAEQPAAASSNEDAECSLASTAAETQPREWMGKLSSRIDNVLDGWPQVDLQGCIRQGTNCFALINGERIRLHEKVGGATLIEIHHQYVVLEHDGERRKVFLTP